MFTRRSCAICAGFEINCCKAAAPGQAAATRPDPFDIAQSDHRVPPRKIICREQDMHDAVPVICSGWAASVTLLPNGRRQILSFLLTGDMVSTALLFGSTPNSVVETITAVEYRTFRRTELKSLVFARPDLMDAFARIWVDEKARCDELIIDLGRRTAEERIARLILHLRGRLIARGLVAREAVTIDFPLRHHHIADAVGLTPVHASKVISEFRRRGLLVISDRSLTILDPDGLRRLAELRR